MEFELIALAKAGVMAFAYSLLVYQRKNPGFNSDNFKWNKFGATMVVGLIVGVPMALTGDPLSAASLEAELAAYGGLTVLIENVLKLVVGEYRSRFQNAQ